jgi:hypothetical protein
VAAKLLLLLLLLLLALMKKLRIMMGALLLRGAAAAEGASAGLQPASRAAEAGAGQQQQQRGVRVMTPKAAKKRMTQQQRRVPSYRAALACRGPRPAQQCGARWLLLRQLLCVRVPWRELAMAEVMPKLMMLRLKMLMLQRQAPLSGATGASGLLRDNL